jgi:hypothetical protein
MIVRLGRMSPSAASRSAKEVEMSLRKMLFIIWIVVGTATALTAYTIMFGSQPVEAGNNC